MADKELLKEEFKEVGLLIDELDKIDTITPRFLKLDKEIIKRSNHINIELLKETSLPSDVIDMLTIK